jgi:hypothetical protein
MKLLSVTISNYRVHKQITVEFDTARNVIGAPNEAGKSTLVEAVHHAFFLRSRITGAVQKAMLSELYPGHPTVELRFESGGRDYTITKVFSGNQSASTTLKEHGVGGRTLRDEEAEERVHEILQAEDVGGGRNIDSRLRMQWAHLWIWQGSATDDPLTHANAERHAAQRRDRLSRVDGGGVLESPLDASASRDIATRYAATFSERGKERAGSGLDSATKNWIGGFEIYMQQRIDRLAKLADGAISLSFLLHQFESRAVLDISIQDSGPGFDFNKRLTDASALSEANERVFGRGIALVNSLCEQVVYSGTGNKVWCRYVVSDLVLDVMLVAKELELDDVGLSVADLDVHQLKVDVGLQCNRVKLVRQVIVVGDGKKALHLGTSGDVVNDSIHTSLVDRLGLSRASICGLLRYASFARDRRTRFATLRGG